jgi:hypothetical protein
MRIKVIIMLVFLIGILVVTNVFAQRKKEINKSFDSKEEVRIKLVLGECTLGTSSDGKIHVQLIYTYDDENFEVRFNEKTRSIVIQEKIYGQDARGESRWTIQVPQNTEIDFESATGDLYVQEFTGRIDGSTGTGDIELIDAAGKFKLNSGTGDLTVSDCQGEFDLNSGTGRVKVESCKGNYEVNSGTGRVKGHDIFIMDEAEFNCGTGKAEVSRPGGVDFDLSINSGTDDAVLIMDGSPVEGYFEFTADGRRGDIKSAVDFDEEEEYENGDGDYLRKSFTKGKKTPRYFISTGSGTAELKL